MIFLSRKAHFCAAHKLYNPQWDKAKNEEIYGECANENWHGHNFDLIVTVKGKPSPDTGFVMNFKDLNRLIKTKILQKVDHKNLNLDVDFMKGKLTTCENLAIEFWNILDGSLKNEFPEVRMHSIRLYETPRNYAEYFGP